MVFQPRLRQFLLLPSAEMSVNIPRKPLRHTALPVSHSRYEGSRLDSVPVMVTAPRRSSTKQMFESPEEISGVLALWVETIRDYSGR